MEEEALDENLGALGRALERNRRRAMSLAGSSASEVPGPSRTTVAEISPSTEVKAIISPTKDRKSFVTVKPSHSKEAKTKDDAPTVNKQPEGLQLAPRTQNIPVSLELEHRTIVIQANRMILEVKSFQNTYKLDAVDADSLLATAKEMIDYLRVGLAASTYMSFYAVMQERQADLMHSNKALEYDQLQMICKRSMHFEDVYKSYKKYLLPCLEDHLKIYCVSYVKEDPNKEVQVVQDYEEKIRQLQLRINDEVKKVELLVDSFRGLCVPFVPNFLSNLKAINRKYSQICTLMTDICELMKRWVTHDKNFPKKLWDSYIQSSSLRNKLLEEVKMCEKRRAQIESQIDKREGSQDKVAQKVELLMEAAAKVRREQDFLADRVQRSEAERQDLQSELRSTEERIGNKDHNTPEMLENMWHRMDMFKTDISKISERITAIHEQMQRMDDDIQKKEQELEKVKQDLVSHEDGAEALYGKLEEAEQQLEEARYKVEEVEARCLRMKAIRDKKIATESLRELYMESFNVKMTDKVASSPEN